MKNEKKKKDRQTQAGVRALKTEEGATSQGM